MLRRSVLLVILTGRELPEAYRLRHRVFREELKWLPESLFGSDKDEYDDRSLHLGRYHGNKLVAYTRLTPRPFMMEGPLGIAYPGPLEDSALELSRLIASRLSRRELQEFFAEIFEVAASLADYVYIVSTPKVIRATCQMGWPWKELGPVVQIPPTMEESQAAVLELRHVDSLHRSPERASRHRAEDALGKLSHEA